MSPQSANAVVCVPIVQIVKVSIAIRFIAPLPMQCIATKGYIGELRKTITPIEEYFLRYLVGVYLD